ncbi:MAG: serine/threonine-protein kinase [Gemmataceae bacterium]
MSSGKGRLILPASSQNSPDPIQPIMQPPPLNIGMEPFPGYRLLAKRGKGGFAEVWEAEHKNGNKVANVALKFLSGFDSRSAPREIRAIQMVKQLNHPNLTKVHQVLLHGSYLIISMELADGSLQDLFEIHVDEFQETLPADKICYYLTHAAKGLDFLNKRQHSIDGQLVSIQHCDVKPGNLLLFGETCKVTDFGLAASTSAKMKSHRQAGTLDFAAPEVFLGQLSENSDQYSLAITYYYLRTGQMPYPHISTFERNWPMTRPPADLSQVTPGERAIIERGLHRVPQDRFPSSTAMMNELTKAVQRAMG